MEYKSILASKLERYNLMNKFYTADVVKGRKYYDENHILYSFSPRKEKMVIVFDTGIYAYYSLFNNSIKFDCSCNKQGVCEHFIPSILYLKNTLNEVDEMCSCEDNSYNIAKLTDRELLNYLSRIVGPYNFLINEMADEFDCNTIKLIRKIITEKDRSNVVFELLVILAKLEYKSTKVDVASKIYELLAYISTLEPDVVQKGFNYICSKMHFTKVISFVQTYKEVITKDEYQRMINFLLEVTDKLSLYESNKKLQVIKSNYLLTYVSGDKFYEYAIGHLDNIDIKKNFMNYLLLKGRFQEIVDHYDDDNDEQIKKCYFEALFHTDESMESLIKILENYPSPIIIKKYFEKGIITDKKVVYDNIKYLPFSERVPIFIALNDYEKLFYESERIGFLIVMDYAKELYENCKELFIPYFENKIIDDLKSGKKFNSITKYLRTINGLKFGGYYLRNLILYLSRNDIVKYDDTRSMNLFIRELNV